MTAPPLLCLVLDAVPYGLMARLHAEGRLPGFAPPRALVAPFPSLTTVAVPRLALSLTDAVPPGYESRWFHPPSGEVRGGLQDTASEAPLAAFHGRPGGAIAHLSVYALPSTLAYHQVRWLTGRFARDGGPWLGWITATDGVAHFEGEDALRVAVIDVLGRVRQVCATFEEEHGVAPRVVLCSDHGSWFGRLSHLDALQVTLALRRADVGAFALVPLGDVGAGCVHCELRRAPEVARVVAELPGVDLAVARVAEGAARVIATRGEGRVEWDGERTRWVPERGEDPLRLGDRVGRWRTDAEWLADALDDDYPAAPPRIRDGLTTLVEWPAPVLFSMADGATYGAPLAHVAARLIGGQVGTHGALSRAQSLGFAATAVPEPWAPGPVWPQEVFAPWRDRLSAGRW